MEKNASPVTVKVTFKDTDGDTVAAPEGVSFSSATAGVDTLAFNATQNADGTYDLVVTPAAVGTDTVSAAGLSGSLPVTVTPLPASSVSFDPASV